MSEYRLIPLTGKRGAGMSAKVDADVYVWASAHKWCLNNGGYAVRRTDGRLSFLHREIMNPPADRLIDHKNRERLDCRRENLRLCTNSQNLMNSEPNRGESEYKGVCKVSSRWRAEICKDQQRYTIGTFDSEETAARAYDAAALTLFGEFARPNFGDSEAAPLASLRPIKRGKNNSSVYRGVCLNPVTGKWYARYKKGRLGTFPTETEAAQAYNVAAAADLGEKAILNPV